MSKISGLPETGFVRLYQIIGRPKTDPPTLGVYPVGKTTWWNGIRDGVYPPPVQLSSRCVAWRVEDIRSLIERAASGWTDK